MFLNRFFHSRSRFAPLGAIVVILLLALAAGCSDSPRGSLQPELSEALEDKWAPILAANKIGRVDFSGDQLRVGFGVSGSAERPVNAQELPNYTDDPLPFTVLVHRTPGGPVLEVYAELEQPRYRPYRVRRDIDSLLHDAMTLFLRQRKILEDEPVS